MEFTKSTQVLALATGVLCMSLMACAADDSRRQASSTETREVRQVDLKAFDKAMVYPGAALSEYSKVFIDVTSVEFDPAWRGNQTGTRLSLSRAKRNAMLAEVRSQFDRHFRAGFTDRNYSMVDSPGQGVAHIRVKIFDLRITAADTAARPSGSFARSSGSVAIELEILDGETGQLLAELEDHALAHQSTDFRNVSEAVAMEQLGRLFRAWSEIVAGGVMRINRQG